MLLRASLVSALAAAVLSGLASASAAENQGRTWAQVAKLPDFTTGIWEIPLGPDAFKPQAQPALTPAYSARLKAYNDAKSKGGEQDNPSANCVPPGMPEIMGQPYPIEFFFGPGQVVIQQEAYQQIRHVYTDGRAHPADPDQTYNGNSIGHWEGDALVIDTVGLTPDTPLGLSYGLRHSAKMHIVERMHLTDPDTLQVTTTIDDPEALAQPWTTTRTFKRHRDWTISEYVCEQNNRNLVDANGRAGIVLAPPPKDQ
jgi:hypothetical protein